MRIPVPLVILLALSVIGGVWWFNTRNSDFLTPPTEDQLAAIRTRVEASNAQPERAGDPVAPPVLKKIEPGVTNTTILEQPPSIELGDLESPPTLEAYSERALDGHAKLAELAAALESEGEFQRSLLAWERSLDLTRPDPEQTATAISAIKRLRPTLPDWNADPTKRIPIILHAGTGPGLAEDLRPALEEAARQLTLASAGILNVTSTLAVGKRAATKGPVPAALWLSGPLKESVSTDVLSFTIGKDEVLQDEIYKTAFLLISSHLKRSSPLTPPADPISGEKPLEVLQSHITRLAWRDFGKSLNVAPDSTD